MFPGRTLVLLAIIPVVLAVFALAEPMLLWPMLAVDAGIVIIALVDAALAWKPQVQLQHSAREVFSIGQRNVVELQWRSDSRRKLSVTLLHDHFDASSSEDLPVTLVLPPHGRAHSHYHITPHQRGAYRLGDHGIRYPSPLGLWIRQLTIPNDQVIKVFPDVRAVRTYELLARQNRESSMFRSRKRRGGESEFERLRDYRREDEFRSIDWKATARRGRLIAREYQMESNQTLMFALDAGRLMTAEANGLSLFDHALNATLMLSHVAARNGDQVGLLAFAHDVKSYTPPAAGQRATQRIIHAGYQLQPQLVESNYRAAFEQLSSRVRKRALVMVFTQVVDEEAGQELLRLTRGLLPRHLPLLVLFRDVEVDALLESKDPPTAATSDLDLYVKAAAAETLQWRDRIANELRNQGALILDVAPQELTPALINRYLEVKARHLL